MCLCCGGRQQSYRYLIALSPSLCLAPSPGTLTSRYTSKCDHRITYAMVSRACIRSLSKLGRTLAVGSHSLTGLNKTMMGPCYTLTRNLTTATKETKVGVIGCGQVGEAVTNNLTRKGYRVVAACDSDPRRLVDLPSSVSRVSTPREVVQLSDVILTCLPKPPNVKAVAEGSDGVLTSLTAGKIWIDHSTTEFEQTQASYIKVFYVGDTVGAAMVIKVVSNMLCCVHVIAMGEALMLGKRANIDLRTFWDGIRLSVGNSFVWETAAPVVFNGGEYDPGFSLSLQNKDLQLGYDMARKYKVPMDMHQMALSIYRKAEYQFGEEAGCYIVPKAIELALGESLQSPGFDTWEYDNVVENGSLITKHVGVDV
ncbi:2-(hydroxymethyl)glutarate dehydrogenase-like isoform X3 [Homarus americanus]|uniref:2-(hydroxymethyl)glutarate dehydrogenase-like isoform X3 n=1 Tax=Homarus americanus TaxID=6706 RepID=UPI001C4796C2|nr:2-(hydroxymethyl)glutarate dehydrogenase-like isoform X3 [Homarus americanus]